jgi:hypothetical protein
LETKWRFCTWVLATWSYIVHIKCSYYHHFIFSLDATTSNRTKGEKTKWSYYAGIGRPIRDVGGKKMATEVGKEYTWQDVAPRLIEHYKTADTSSTSSNTRI